MKYWTANNVDWYNVEEIEVTNNSVYIIRADGTRECIATRKTQRECNGYADALSRARKIPIRYPIQQAA